MEIGGACLCGDVTWRATIDPGKVWVCHCTDCQVNSASAYRYGVRVEADNFELLTGDLKVFVKTAESGNRRALSFCPRCGTSIHGGNDGPSDWYSLRLGGCHQRRDLQPHFEIYRRSALDWAGPDCELHSFEEGLPPR